LISIFPPNTAVSLAFPSSPYPPTPPKSFNIKTFGLNGQLVSAVVHYNVTGKPDGYQTLGQVLQVTSASGAGVENQEANNITVGTTAEPSSPPTVEETVTPVEPAAQAVSPIESAPEPAAVVEPAPAQ
jgi:hypothetical protein